jgi:hypothetical protein
MKRIIIALVSVFILLGIKQNVVAQDVESLVRKMTTIDPEIIKYFPRWKICETDLQIQIYRTFVLLGYDKDKLNMQQIMVLASPPENDNDPYDLLLITCGEASMNSVEIESNMSGLASYISGEYNYSGPLRGERKDFAFRDYCFDAIKPEIPVTSSQAEAIISYLEPTNVAHAFTLSLFEQTLKIGNTGFWLRSSIGTDEIGYHFWSSGESRITLKRPLYANLDSKTRDRIPYLLNAYIGGGYRISSGINTENTVLNWIPNRTLNGGPGGKFIAGLDFHMPFQPEFGIHINAELPLSSLTTETIEKDNYGYIPTRPGVVFNTTDPRYNKYVIDELAPIVRSTGQVTLFYHWWLNDANPENYFRFDFGISYSEIGEYAEYSIPNVPASSGSTFYISNIGIRGLKLYKPNELGDWMFLKAEYRNQSAFPFGLSLQYSNQILLGDIYIPLFGKWLYLEGKYSTPLRGLRPFERTNFFMVSPVLRLTI